MPGQQRRKIMSDEEFWEQWCGSTARPVQRIKRG
jgi:hypothetical protein